MIIRPTGDLSAIRIDVTDWSNKEQKELVTGSFYVIARNGALEIKTFTDWDTRKSQPLAVSYYKNDTELKEVRELKAVRVSAINCVDKIKEK